MAWYQLLPESAERFTLRIYNCVRREVLEDPDQRAALDGGHAILRVVHEQDIGACESVWAGLQSGHF